MGINTAHSCSWKAHSVPTKLLFDLNIGNRLDVDGNALAYALHPKSKGNINLLLHEIITFLKNLSSMGFIVQVIFDNLTTRPNTKRAATEQRKEHELNIIQSSCTKLNIVAFANVCMRSNDPSIHEQFDVNEKLLKSIESAVKRKMTLPSDFDVRLREKIIANKLNEMNICCGYVNSDVLVAKFEADYVIARRFLNGECNFIYGEDSDFYALVGPSVLLLWDFLIQSKKNDLMTSTFDVRGCGRRMFVTCKRTFGDKIAYKEIKFDVFDHSDYHIRAVTAVTMGCDVYAGISRVGPAALKSLLNKYESLQDPSLIYERLLNDLSLKAKIPVSVLNTYCHAFMGQVAVTVDEEEYLYIWNDYSIPTTLSEYLNDFIPPHIIDSSNTYEVKTLT